ncbi:MAG TPA: hypothetical protein VNO70_27720, partial [Blastocatellia bacterium]|nr:hypothetical protein [Blastocatellia bacterium]
MRAVIVRVSLIAILLVIVGLAGALPTLSDSAQRPRLSAAPQAKGRTLRPATAPLTYRSPGARHKLLLPDDARSLDAQITPAPERRSRRYGSYTLVEVTDAELQSLAPAALEKAQLRDDLNLVLLRRGQIDTTAPAPEVQSDLRQPEDLPRSLRLVQLFGPPTPDDLRALKATGARVVSYVP